MPPFNHPTNVTMNNSMYLLPQNGSTKGMTNGSAANNRSLTSTPNNTRSIITSPDRLFRSEPESGPYAPIEKRRLQTADGMDSAGYTVRIADPDEESGWRECGVVSGDYLLIPNARVRDLAGEIAYRSGLPFEEDRTFFDGKRYFLGLTAKEAQTVEVKPGDVLGLSLGFWNSYDGSRAFSAGVYLTRLVCSNGMVAKSLFKEVRFRHGPGASEWESEVERTLGALRHAEGGIARFAMAARSLASMRMSSSRLREIRRDVLPNMPVTLWGKVVDRYLLEEELSGWGLLNAATSVTWHADRPTVSDFRHNEYAVSSLIEHALSRPAN